MKKTIFLFAAASIALGASAQLKVVESGQVQVGAVTASSAAVADTLATIQIGGPGYAYSGGRISFGNGTAYIESPQFAYNQFGGKNRLRFGTGNGFSFYSGTNYKVIEGTKHFSFSEVPPVCSICITKPGYKPYRFLFINDKVITESMEYDCDMAIFGKSEITSNQEVNTTISKGRTTINAGTTVLGPGSTVEKGAELIINPITK